MSAAVLLIGGTRFLGREITRAFTSRGHRVFVMNRGSREASPEVAEAIRCDKTDRGAFSKVLRRQRWDVVVDTVLDAEDLEFVVETLGVEVGHFIHTGSMGVYGDARQIPATENLPLAEYEGEYVVFNYKIQQDQVLLRAFQERGFPATILRASYIYGPGCIPLDGWGGRAVEFFQMLRDEKTILLPDNGRALLHPGHVRDLSRAFVHAAGRPESIGQVFNVGGSHALMMKDYVGRIAKAMGVEARLEFAPMPEVLARHPQFTNERGMRFSGQHMCASIAKAEAQLGWRPEISLDTGLRENIAWMREQGLL